MPSIVPSKAQKEPKIDNFLLSKMRFSGKDRKPPEKTLIITNFCELGVETISCMYSIPKVLEKFPDHYHIAFGWSGRSYFYKHLVDEFWELDRSHYWLKDYGNAFLHNSKNLNNLEKEISRFGFVYNGSALGNFFVGYVCKRCLETTREKINICSKCNGNDFYFPFLFNIDKKDLTSIPGPKIDPELRKIVPENSVAIFARNRKTYGRNLPKEFYQNLNKLLKNKGFVPIYLGENISSLNMDDCIDFSNKPEANDLNFTLSVLSCVKFSVQFWTASTRLAAIVKTPFLLVESQDQLAGKGQEGLRIAMTSDWDKKKLLISHYLDFLENQEHSLKSVSESIDQMLKNNWDHNLSLVKNKNLLYSMLEEKGLLKWQ